MSIGEGDKAYKSMMDKYQMDVQTQNALRGSGLQNATGGLMDLASMGIQYGGYENQKDYLNYLKTH